MFMKCGLGGERFASLEKSDQTSVRLRMGNVVHVFIVVSMSSGLDFVRIEVEEPKILQGLRIAKKIRVLALIAGLAGRRGREDSTFPRQPKVRRRD
jgi:hypothetical protein